MNWDWTETELLQNWDRTETELRQNHDCTELWDKFHTKWTSVNNLCLISMTTKHEIVVTTTSQNTSVQKIYVLLCMGMNIVENELLAQLFKFILLEPLSESVGLIRDLRHTLLLYTFLCTKTKVQTRLQKLQSIKLF